MFWKRYAVVATAAEFNDRSFNFREEPSAYNWMLLDEAMKAHQKAKLLPEYDLETLLNNTRREDRREEQELVVMTLAMKFDQDMEVLEAAVSTGRVKLIRVDELRAA